MQARLFHLHTLSALHCGAGRSAGVIDLPIARARATQLPIVPGSSLRGVLRQLVDKRASDDGETLFGPRTIRSDQVAFAGALSIGDAHLLALPVRCLASVVSFVTCPFILRRHKRDLRRVGTSPPALPNPPDKGSAWVTPASVNLVETVDENDRKRRKLVLEDLDLQAHHDPSLEAWARLIACAVHPEDDEAQTDVIARFSLVSDDVMSFLAETATDVRARIRLDPDTGTVSKGALWYEEHLPAETLLWGVFALADSNNDGRKADDLARAVPNDELLQLGGNAGVGSGLVRFLTEGTPA
ncbi:MAG: type III-B CRISPR module RAMP protein Cmr4 [Acidobacteria bacterium]|nr:type III-B CRISPR module RAMP protein Cmr4 [Acidobacteriota bacterium]